jgi:hypothetical protein
MAKLPTIKVEVTPLVYEVDLSKKYVLTTDATLSHEEYERISGLLREWVNNNEPFVLLDGGIKLARVSDIE